MAWTRPDGNTCRSSQAFKVSNENNFCRQYSPRRHTQTKARQMNQRDNSQKPNPYRRSKPKACQSVFLTLLLAGCIHKPYEPIQRTEGAKRTNTANISSRNPPNLLKRLEEYRCEYGYPKCSITRVKEACIKAGFTEKTPRTKIISAVRINEAVSFTVEVKTQRTNFAIKEQENGVVYAMPQTREAKRHERVEGRCQGTEYVLK